MALSIDHITPKSKGGADYPSNLRAAHLSCNKSRCNKEDGEHDVERQKAFMAKVNWSKELYKCNSENNSNNHSENNSLPEEEGKGREGERNGNESEANASGEPPPETTPKTTETKAQKESRLRQAYEKITAECKGKPMKEVQPILETFIATESPPFIEPYVDLWRVFATKNRLAIVEAITDPRRKKFKTRMAEPPFDFLTILQKISGSARLRGVADGSDWKVTWDWIFENGSNYVKIIEGNFD